MNRFFCHLLPATLMAIVFLAPQSARACAACFGQSNDQMAQGMNWGIASLLVVIVSVLGGIASFFVYIARKSSAAAAAENGQPKAELPTTKNQ